MSRLLRAAIACAFAVYCCLGVAASPASQQHPQLAEDIDRILRQTRTPGAAIALIEPDGSVWHYATGLKSIEDNAPVASGTIFRVGSVSKILVSMAVMRLVAEGTLSLQDRLSEVAPELEFYNPWESQHPVRVIHLLNHTTGWDAPHPAELAGREGKPLSIREVLALHPHSRESRWVPGSRSAYNNTGPLAAAYIVEKITGRRFEDYIQSQFFDPLGMTDSGYFFDDQYRSRAAELYRGNQKLPYWNLPNRAAGGLHSSAADLIRLVRYMQNPDAPEMPDLLPGDYLRMMEAPSGSFATDAGLQVGWGLGLTSYHHENLVLYGHEGALPGARALLAYQPNGTAGHVVLTNGESPAMGKIHKLLMQYSYDRLGQTAATTPIAERDSGASLAGFYRVISPVADRFRIAHVILPWKISNTASGLELAPLIGGAPRKLNASEPGEYLQTGSNRVVLVQAEDPLAGRVVHYGPMTLQKSNPVIALAPAIFLIAWLLSVLAAVFQLVAWLIRKVRRVSLPAADARIRRWSALPLAGLLVGLVGLFIGARSSDPYATAAAVSAPSILVFLGTLVFFIAALEGLRVWVRERRDATGGFWFSQATLLIFLNVGFGTFLLSYGLIGLRLWA